MVPSDIDTLLAKVAVTAERLDEATWRAVVQVEHGQSFRLFVRLAGGFARAELSPFLALPDEPKRQAVVMRELLHRNRTLHEARFALDDDGDVLIETVIDATQGVAALEAALDALFSAAEAHYTALHRL